MHGTAAAGGAYGLALTGVDGARLLSTYPETWVPVQVEQREEAMPLAPPRLGSEQAEVPLIGGGRVFLDRRGTVVFRMPKKLDDDEIVHPFIATAAEIFSWWLGRRSFHAGAFVVDGRAWALFGEKGAGKSTMLAQLALDGIPVLTDDILVSEGPMALAGPRCIDLRNSAVGRFGVNNGIERARSGQRWRLPLPEIDAEVPLAGWISLTWGGPEAISLRPTERLRLLSQHGGGRPETLLALAELPAFEFRRSRDWGDLPRDAARLVEFAGTREPH